MSVETLKSICDIAAVVLLFLTAVAGTGVLITGSIINTRQVKQLRQFDSYITEAKTDLAKQQVRAATAEGKIALAEQHSKEASAKAEGFRLSIARADESAEKAKAQAAEATAETARANLELARIKLPRSLNSEQQGRVSQSLAQFSGTNYAFVVFSDPESMALLNEIDSLLQRAGWIRVIAPAAFSGDLEYNTPRGRVFPVSDIGLKASYPPNVPAMEKIVVAIANAISAEGVPCEPHSAEGLRGTQTVLISVGQKRL